MDSPRTDTNSSDLSKGSGGPASSVTSTGNTAKTQSFWHDCKTPEPLPQAPPVLVECPVTGVLSMQQGVGLQESDWEMSDPVELKATKAEVRTLAQHHLDKSFSFSVWFSAEGAAGSSDIARQFYHFDRFHQLRALLDDKDHKFFGEIIQIRNEYIRKLEAEQDARNAFEAGMDDQNEWGPEQAAREEWEANQDPRD